jgi:curli production assembly/transport component CsgG
MVRKGLTYGLIWIGVMISAISCSPLFHQPFGTQDAELGPETQMKRELLELPEPQEKIVAAVYKFRDQTGQYKPSQVGASWSTAVTQGATNILIRALEESGWFIPIERENISNLLNERKIIRSSREQYEGSSSVALPPLLFAGVLIEGGIVSYETNVYTGGAGVRYFGSDASAQYREDRVTIYLRAVSTSNGMILKTVYTTKSILSQEVSVGVFRYVKFKRLLEAETGYTYNEPTEMAITEAIEKGIYSLILEGVMDDIWSLKYPHQENTEIFEEYRKEKEENLNEDLLGRQYPLEPYRNNFFFSVSGLGQWYNGDYSKSGIRPGGTISLGFGLGKHFYLTTGFSSRFFYIEDLAASFDYASTLDLMFMATPQHRYSPYLKAGFGTLYDFGGTVGVSDKNWLPFISFGAGLEIMVSKNFGFHGGAFINPLMMDYFDGAVAGTYNDFLWGFDLGLKLYF